MTIKLPPLPDTPWLGYDPERGDLFGFDVEALRAHGKACALAALEEAAKRLSLESVVMANRDQTRGVLHSESLIRALRTELENTK